MIRDPSGISQLFDEVERRLDETVDACHAAWVNQDARKQFHERVHTIVNTLFSALWNDLGMLQVELGCHIFAKDDHIPTVAEMAEQIPKLFSLEAQGAVAEQQLATNRLRWVFVQWMQVQMNLFSMLSGAKAVAAAAETSGFITSVGRATDFEEPYLVLGTVGRLKELTFEYLQYREKLLEVHDKPAFGLQVNWDRKPQHFVNLAWKSYHRGEPTAGHLLLLGMRMALLNVLDLQNLPPKYTLETLATHQLLVVAFRSGITIPLGLEAIGNILIDLEQASARCLPLRESFLLPFMRMGEEVVQGLATVTPTPEQLEKARKQLGLAEPTS